MFNNRKRPSKTYPHAHLTKLCFADGSVAWFPNGSAFDFVFAPTFLKYVTICVGLFALLHDRQDLAVLGAWERLAVWFAVLAAIILWFLIIVAVLLGLRKITPLPGIYTPFLTVPCVFITEWAAYQVMLFMQPVEAITLSFQVTYMIQATVVVVLFDILFGSFVASHHPVLLLDPNEQAQADPPVEEQRPEPSGAAPMPNKFVSELPPTAEPAATETHKVKADDGPQLDIVQIAGRDINPVKLVHLQIEDHYLRVQTVDENFLVRHKLRDAVSEIGPEHGVQVNRSTWVAGPQLRVLTREGPNRAFVTLKDGTDFPVSRSRMPAVLSACDTWSVERRRKSA